MGSKKKVTPEKWASVGALVGIVIGILFVILFPRLLEFELLYNIEMRKALRLPLTHLFDSGSVYAVGSLFPLLLGIGGYLVGYNLFKYLNKEK